MSPVRYELGFYIPEDILHSPAAAARRRRGGPSGIGVGFLLVRQFPLPILIPPNAP
jgi:hypothetical protein